MSPYQIPIQIALDDMQARIEARRNNFSGGVESRNTKSPDKSGGSSKDGLMASAHSLVQSNNDSGISAPPTENNLPVVPALAESPAEIVPTLATGSNAERLSEVRESDNVKVPGNIGPGTSCSDGQTNLNGIGNNNPAEVSSEDTRPNGSVLTPPAAQDQFTPAEFRARITRQAMGVEAI